MPLPIKPPKLFSMGLGDPQGDYTLRVLRVPRLDWARRALSSQLNALCFASRWEVDPLSDITPTQIGSYFAQNLLEFWEGSAMLGTLCWYFTDTAPIGVLPLDGSVIPRAAYPRLWERIDPALKDADNIYLPDMTGRGVVQGATVGQEQGADNVTLTVDQLPSHTHSTVPHFHSFIGTAFAVGEVGVGVPVPSAVAVPSATEPATVAVNPTGSGQQIDIRPKAITAKAGIWAI